MADVWDVALDSVLILALFFWVRLLSLRGPFFWKHAPDRYQTSEKKWDMKITIQILGLKLSYLWLAFFTKRKSNIKQQ
ncbi:hypothetical protein DRW42_03590 [Pedobacter miscanthi]|uniref:Uncharacterized protein n=1 Tax=Pedobacter miscanthi TaxID=2259170 RepID=A0A366LCH9_9SPHI|nr:hypothetical protein DRW42_03590 [Pedobacter miscanthi]